MIEQLRQAGRTEIVHATVDGDPESVDNIRYGRLTRIDSAQFCAMLGATAVRQAYRVLNGRQVARHVMIPTFPVTRETLDIYPGWDGDLPATFNKPWPAVSKQWRNQLREDD